MTAYLSNALSFIHPLTPYPIDVLRGIESWFLDRTEWYDVIANLFACFMVYSIMGILFSTTYMFVYRYLITVQHRHLYQVQRMRTFFLSFGVYALFGTLTIIIPAEKQMLNDRELKAMMKDVDPDAYLLMKDYVSLGFNVGFANFYLNARLQSLSIFIQV